MGPSKLRLAQKPEHGRVLPLLLIWLLRALLFSSGAQAAQSIDAVRQLISQGEFARAEAWIDRQRELKQEPELDYLLGFIRIQQYRYPEAESLLQRALETKSDEADWWLAPAKSQLEQRKNLRARSSLDRGIAQRDGPDLHFARAMCALNLGDLDQAERDLRVTVQMSPGNSEALFKLAQILYDRGNPEESHPLLLRALEVTPSHLEARVLLGQTALRLSDTTAARRAFETVLTRVPGHVTALYNLGRLLLNLGDRELGGQRLEEFRIASRQEDQLQFLREALKKEPLNLPGRLKLVRLALASGRNEEAIENLSISQRLAPRNQEVYLLLADAYQRSRQTEDALRAARFARTLGGSGQ